MIGFKPKESLKNYHNKRPSLFLIPDDDLVVNSSQAIDALIKELVRADKIGIARIKKK